MRSGVHVAVTRVQLDPAGLLARVGSSADGAVVLFLGVVRDLNEGREVEGILYEGYEPMAEALLQELARGTIERFGVTAVAVEHRLGSLGVGEASVAVAVSSPHRAQAFDGARWLMDTLKERIPIWKKEHFVDGGSAWIAGRDPRSAGASLPPDGAQAPEEPPQSRSEGAMGGRQR